MTKTDYALVRDLGVLLNLVADVMQDLKVRGISTNFSINPGTDPVSVIGPTATREIAPDPAPAPEPPAPVAP